MEKVVYGNSTVMYERKPPPRPNPLLYERGRCTGQAPEHRLAAEQRTMVRKLLVRYGRIKERAALALTVLLPHCLDALRIADLEAML